MEQRERLSLPLSILTKHGSHASAQHDTHTCTRAHIWDLAAGLPRYGAFCFCFAAQPFSLFSPSFFSTSTACRCTAWGTLKAVGILLWGGDGGERQNSEPHVLRQEVLGNMWSSLYESRWKPQAVKHQQADLLSVNKLKRVHRSGRDRGKRCESKTNELRDFLDCRSVSVSVCDLLRCFKWASAGLMVTGLTSQVSPSISLSDATCLLFIHSENYNCLFKNNREDEPQRDTIKFVYFTVLLFLFLFFVCFLLIHFYILTCEILSAAMKDAIQIPPLLKINK